MPRTGDLLRGFLLILRLYIDRADDEVLIWAHPWPARESAEIAFELMRGHLVVYFSRLDDEMTAREFGRHLMYWYEDISAPVNDALCNLIRDCIAWDAAARYRR